ncbi:MAG: peptide chain release factor N(5)-glutamine methyltransferase [Chloroflexi bacterium]|nr:peptide chain release factor N(5)-glutamine methyltransferase [Chloroflexota bacterium]
MTLKQALARAREVLSESNTEDAALEAELLLRHTLKIDRVRLYLELERELSSGEEQAFWQLIERRLKHEPAAYITGHREFYGLEYYVDSNVLIPRPETELLVEKAVELAKGRSASTIADVGTGSGAIAIALALHLPEAEIYATDISVPALRAASFNCRKHGVTDRVHLLAGDLLEPLPEPVDLIAANLPYVVESELPQVNTGGFEPALALNGGPDGLEKIRRLCLQAGDKLRPSGGLLLEIGQGQGSAVISLLRAVYPLAAIEMSRDFAGIDRVVSLVLPPVASQLSSTGCEKQLRKP